jgi:glycyl-tRNA synthetase (class II)
MNTYVLAFMIIPRRFILRVRSFSHKVVKTITHTHTQRHCLFNKLLPNILPFIRYRARQETAENIIRHMCFACWVTEATNIHSEYVILLAFARY